MSYKIVVKESADLDTTAIETYLAACDVSPEVVLAPIAARITKDLTEFPYMYPVCQFDERFRQMPVKSYLVLYHVDEEKRLVEIHHIWHGKRNIIKLLKENRNTES